MKYPTYELPNGMKLIHKHSDSPIAHCGLLINTGSRDEDEDEHGIAHLIEHLIFKGTKKRRAYHILSRLEDVGGELNAFTSKEDTCIHSSFLHEYYDRTLELLSDIVFNSVFPEKEMEKEKEVVIDEINSCKDNPGELIYDEFEKMLFNGNPIGRSILGTPYNVKHFTPTDIRRFIRKHYAPSQMVLSSVGNIRFDKLLSSFQRYFGSFSAKNVKQKRKPNKDYKPSKRSHHKSTHQTHCIIGNVAYNLFQDKKNSLYLLNNILGGPCLNSRLTMTIREKYGYAYNIESSYNPYSDTGAFAIYFGTDNGNLEKTITLVKKELNKLCTHKLGTNQLAKAQKQLIGQLAISWESNENQMLNIGKSFMMFNKVDEMRDITRKIESITASELLEVANEILDEKQLTQLIYY